MNKLQMFHPPGIPGWVCRTHRTYSCGVCVCVKGRFFPLPFPRPPLSSLYPSTVPPPPRWRIGIRLCVCVSSCLHVRVYRRYELDA